MRKEGFTAKVLKGCRSFVSYLSSHPPREEPPRGAGLTCTYSKPGHKHSHLGRQVSAVAALDDGVEERRWRAGVAHPDHSSWWGVEVVGFGG